MLFFSSGAFFLYQIDRAFSFSPEDTVNAPERVEWNNGHRSYSMASTAASALLMAILLPRLPVFILPWLAAIGVLGIVHALPSMGGRRRLKSIPYLKTASISIAWMVGGVIIPLTITGISSVALISLLCLYRLPVIVSNQLVADFVDREGDQTVSHKSILTTFSERRVKLIVLSLLGSSAVFGVLVLMMTGSYLLVSVDMVGLFLMLYFCLRDHPLTRNTSFILDVLVGWPLITFLLWSLL